MRIGIGSACISWREPASILQTDQGRAVVFLLTLMRDIPFVEDVLLLDPTAGATEHARLDPKIQAKIVSPLDVCGSLDIIICMDHSLDARWLNYVRACGSKCVYFPHAHIVRELVESVLFHDSRTSLRTDGWDCVWIHEGYEKYAPMLGALYRCEVRALPYLWMPLPQTPKSTASQTGNDRPGALRVAVVEENVSVTNMCSMPLLICDTAWKADTGCVASLTVLAHERVRTHKTFEFFANSLSVLRATNTEFVADLETPLCPSSRIDAVVSYQIDNPLNPRYLECLHSGIALVHNSAVLSEGGYYYKDACISQAASQLLKASRDKVTDLSNYRARAMNVVSRMNPLATCNLRSYATHLGWLGARRELMATRQA